MVNSSALPGTQELTLKYGVSQGDLFAFDITKLDSGFDPVGLGIADFKIGDQITLEILADVSSVSAEYADFMLLESFVPTDTRDLFKETYPNGTAITSMFVGTIFPIQGTLQNGTVLDIEDLLRIWNSVLGGDVTTSGNEVTQSNSLIYEFEQVFFMDTGVLKSYTITDLSGNVFQMENGDYTPDNGDDDDDDALPISMISITIALGMMGVIIRRRKNY